VADGRPAAVINHLETSRVFVTKIEEYERHPQCDLAIARLADWNARSMFAGYAEISPLNDVVCVGYPLEAMREFAEGDLGAVDNPRYLKGYVTRGIDTARDDFAQTASFELSFPVEPGMSGSPVWSHVDESGERVLCGIALGAQSELALLEETTTEAADGVKELTRVIRVRDFGVALRLSAVLDWRISMLDDAYLGDLVPNDGSGALPDHLAPGLETGRMRLSSEDEWPDDHACEPVDDP